MQFVSRRVRREVSSVQNALRPLTHKTAFSERYKTNPTMTFHAQFHELLKLTYHVCCIQRSRQNCSASFVDSILQAYVMAPFFVLLEVHTWFPIALFLASQVRWEVVWYCDTRRRSLKFNPCIKLEEALLPHGGSHFLIPSVVSFWSRNSLLKPFALSTYPLVGCNK